ncbi:hypothetical protein Naga_100039g36 [Nannochloropsis gaditana]|uniref:Uncharacterized protein n=1 Tax=Nannochloropsis gaditana TaxID=72520 RepID=W7TEX6_9STRA|nr:hypothetical protein Naga_100039g36 [Nannochloropsis gaditana]
MRNCRCFDAYYGFMREMCLLPGTRILKGFGYKIVTQTMPEFTMTRMYSRKISFYVRQIDDLTEKNAGKNVRKQEAIAKVTPNLTSGSLFSANHFPDFVCINAVSYVVMVQAWLSTVTEYICNVLSPKK